MRYVVAVLALAAMVVTPGLAVAGGVGGACSYGAGTTTAQRETKDKQQVKAPQGKRGDEQVIVTQKSK